VSVAKFVKLIFWYEGYGRSQVYGGLDLPTPQTWKPLFIGEVLDLELIFGRAGVCFTVATYFSFKIRSATVGYHTNHQALVIKLETVSRVDLFALHLAIGVIANCVKRILPTIKNCSKFT